jgi:hypothetical protein
MKPEIVQEDGYDFQRALGEAHIAGHNRTSSILTFVGALIVWGVSGDVTALLVGIISLAGYFDRDRFIRKEFGE